MALTLEKKLEIVNAVNTAIAEGRKVQIGDFVLANGVLINRYGSLAYVDRLKANPEHYAVLTINENRRIAILGEVEVIYEPPPKEIIASCSLPSNPDT